MLKNIFIIPFLYLLVSFTGGVSTGEYKVSNGNIFFKSDAVLELIKAQSSGLKGIIITEKKQFAFIVSIKSFKGFNSPLQLEHFNENYMESNKFPTASFEGKIIEDVDFTKDGVYVVRTKGNLSIHGVVQERIIKSEITVKNANISFTSNFTILLSDHNIPIPKVVHQKLASEIKVDITADLVNQ